MSCDSNMSVLCMISICPVTTSCTCFAPHRACPQHHNSDSPIPDFTNMNLHGSAKASATPQQGRPLYWLPPFNACHAEAATGACFSRASKLPVPIQHLGNLPCCCSCVVSGTTSTQSTSSDRNNNNNEYNSRLCWSQQSFAFAD